jgi:hypothetical protein
MKSVLAWLFLPCVAIAFYVGLRFGDEANQHPGAEELKLTAFNLEKHSSDITPQLREYLKGRLYTLLISGIRDDWVDGRVDYGPIDSNVLRRISVVKGPESYADLYRLAMEAARTKDAKYAVGGASH